ncbi:MAG: hypothetical protein H7330_08465 [Hymenobacteraceae bacterium]|nr:hypothetical protein [Hymenobacteraceae bacterium]
MRQLYHAALALLALGARALPARAQRDAYESRESSSVKMRLREQYRHNDTAQALISLYGRRQGSGAIYIVGGVAGAARGATATPTTGYHQTDGGGGVLLLTMLPFVGLGINKLVRFNNNRLESNLALYAAGEPLPHWLKRRLRRRDFQREIIKYTPVAPPSAP